MRSNVGFGMIFDAGCGKRVKVEAGSCVMTGEVAEWGIKLLQRKQDFLILTVRVRDKFKGDGRMRDNN